MNLPLDPASEQIIQREVERGHYATPAEVVAHSLALLDDREAWLLANKEAISERLERSYEQSRRGELYTPEQARDMLAERRAARPA